MSAGAGSESESTTGSERPLAGAAELWSRICEWIGRWVCVFPPDEILREGLSRRFYLRCCNWLCPLEAAVRRLVIAAALVAGPQKPLSGKPSPSNAAPDAARTKTSAADRRPGARSASFRIVSMPGTGKSRPPASAGGSPAPRHLPFPGDHLLRLGDARKGGGRVSTSRASHPLKRRGRPRPGDPDYRPEGEDYANSSSLLFGPFRSETREPRRRPASDAADPAFRNRIAAEPEPGVWRRMEAEWDRILPAPGIAARIAALIRVMEAPERQVARLARRLASEPGLADLLRGAPPPVLRKPPYDPFGPQVDDDLAFLAYAAIRAPDTS